MPSPKGDLLLSKVGTTGIPAMVTTDREFSLFVSVALIKLIQCDINREFLVFMIQSPLVQEQAKENTRGVGNKNWVLSAVSKTLMVVPPLEEQGRIKNRLNLILSYVERYSSSQDKLDLLNANIVTDLKKSILQEAIQGKLVPQIAEEGTAQELLEQIKAEKQKLVKEGILKKSALNDSVVFRGDDNRYCEKIGKSVQCIDEEIPFEIPESWVWCKFQDIANSELGKTMNKASDKGSEVPYLCSINVYWDKVDLSNVKVAPFSIAEKEKVFITKGDLLICEGGEVGRCAIWSNDKTMYYQNALHRVRFFGNISSKFIQNVIRSYKTMGIIDKNSKGMTIKHFTKTALNSLYIPLPPFQEQQRIVAQIEKNYLSNCINCSIFSTMRCCSSIGGNGYR